MLNPSNCIILDSSVKKNILLSRVCNYASIHFNTFRDLYVAVMNEGDILLSIQETHKGLSGLVKLLLGLPLDKKEQFSDWQRRPLRRSQLIYAGILKSCYKHLLVDTFSIFHRIALDAFCLLEVYDFLQKRSQFLQIDWWDVLKKLGTVHHSLN